MTDTVIVTGGAGFIGSHLAARLLKDGHQVRVVDNLLTGQRANLDYLESLNGDYTHYPTSITDLDALIPIFVGADTVYHHAALPSVPLSIEDPLETHHHCVTGTLNVLIAAQRAGVKRVVYAASSAAYGDGERDIETETILPAPLSPYGAAKLAGEHYCQVFNTVYDLETVVLRYFNVFGPRQDPSSHYAAVIPRFITLMLNGERPVIFGDGTQSRDFTFVDNIVQGNLLAAQEPDAAGQTMNLATGKSISLLDLVAQVNHILGTDIAPILTDPRPGDILHSRADIHHATELLDFAPTVDFATGLAQTIAYYQAQS